MGVTNADAFRMLFEGLYASELWSWSEDKFLEWLNSDYAGSALPLVYIQKATEFEGGLS